VTAGGANGSVARAVRDARRALARMARPAGDFDASRYFRLVYELALRLHADREDLIEKAVGWALREAGKTDMPRLERYLRANGPSLPRTTVRYALERFDDAKRRALIEATRG
jgi:3-methyladenine DNA glycosylase AlkD